MTDKYAVIGNPIEHSKSPLIHAAFAKQTGHLIAYKQEPAPLDAFEKTVKNLMAQGYKGVNVTVPFKFEAYKMANMLAQSALGAGAANTLSFLAGPLIQADNTDGLGLVRDIQNNLEIKIAGKRVLIVGAGGAAEGVLIPLLTEKPNLLVVTNRTVAKAEQMVAKIETYYESINDFTRAVDYIVPTAQTFDDLNNQQFDIIINATSTGLTDAALPIPNSIFADGCLAYDMMYGRETPFMAQARANGAQVADGLGMLVEQAAEAFYIWRGVRPQTAPVIAQLRSI